MDQETQIEPDRLVETTSEIFVGEWRRLISTTNWEKGRIIHDWRQALVESEAPVQSYSDETWARRVGSVSSQHVGRLRRVHERFASVRGQYTALYWSHFQAALDWNDAELWLEGARLENWSVSEMRTKRWESHGAPAELKPREEDVISTELDEDYAADANAAFAETGEAVDAYAEAPFDDMAPESESAYDESDDSEEDEMELADSPMAAAPVAAMAGFSSLPDDLLEAFEACKLAIVRHRLTAWSDVSSDTVVAALSQLVELARAPVEA